MNLSMLRLTWQWDKALQSGSPLQNKSKMPQIHSIFEISVVPQQMFFFWSKILRQPLGHCVIITLTGCCVALCRYMGWRRLAIASSALKRNVWSTYGQLSHVHENHQLFLLWILLYSFYHAGFADEHATNTFQNAWHYLGIISVCGFVKGKSLLVLRLIVRLLYAVNHSSEPVLWKNVCFDKVNQSWTG